MRVTPKVLQELLDAVNKGLATPTLELDWCNGGVRVCGHEGSYDVSPRDTNKNIYLFLRGMLANQQLEKES